MLLLRARPWGKWGLCWWDAHVVLLGEERKQHPGAGALLLSKPPIQLPHTGSLMSADRTCVYMVAPAPATVCVQAWKPHPFPDHRQPSHIPAWDTGPHILVTPRPYLPLDIFVPTQQLQQSTDHT